MPYTHFRYIAYEVPTAASYPQKPQVEPARAGYGSGTAPPVVARAPVSARPEGMRPDAENRLRRIASIVDQAKTLIDQSGGDTASTELPRCGVSKAHEH